MEDKTIICPICNKLFNKYGIGCHKWRVHGDGVNFDPNAGYSTGQRSAWNKGLTKADNLLVAKQAERMRRKKTELELELDDDGKLIEKWRNKRVNAKYAGHECFLTFDEYCLLVKQAGIKSSQLGYKGDNYVLARYNDQGDYTFDNCRFITQSENIKERKVSEKYKQGRISASNKLKQLYSNPEYKDRMIQKIKLGIANSSYFKERSECAIASESKRKALLHPSYAGCRNSQYGHFWITNGLDNKSWSLEKGDIPEGYYKGRVNGNKPKLAPVKDGQVNLD